MRVVKLRDGREERGERRAIKYNKLNMEVAPMAISPGAEINAT